VCGRGVRLRRVAVDRSGDERGAARPARPGGSGAPPRGLPEGRPREESLFTPVAEVTRQAERLLSHQTVETQGTLYHLTPRNAPIDLVASLDLALGLPPARITVPGIAVIYRHAAALCGKATAAASWTIHYPIPVSEISSAAGWRFLVKTRTGRRFWGNWCGAGKSASWRAANCY
jgi:hypothetical protein